MVNTEIRLIIFIAAKDEEVLYSQQKQNWELTVAWPAWDLVKEVTIIFITYTIV